MYTDHSTLKYLVNKPVLGGRICRWFKGVGLNLAVLPGKVLHLLYDGMITELRAREQCALQVISEQQINNVQLALQRDFSIATVTDVID